MIKERSLYIYRKRLRTHYSYHLNHINSMHVNINKIFKHVKGKKISIDKFANKDFIIYYQRGFDQTNPKKKLIT